MDNHSFNERNSLTGNSGILGLSGVKPKLQPIRIKAFLDMYGSDDEDSEDRGKDSNSDDECDDIQQLPEDTEENLEQCLTTVMEESAVVSLPTSKEEHIEQTPFLQETEFQPPHVAQPKHTSIKSEENMDCSVSRHFTNNFSGKECSQSDIQGAAGICSELRALSTSKAHFSSSLPLIRDNFRSNVKPEVPDMSHSFNETPVIPIITESTSYSGSSEALSLDLKCESHESSYYSREGHLHLANASQPEPVSSSQAAPQPPSTPASHLVTDTPMKNNPPLGSMRPTPSTAHRTMLFQTPRSNSMVHHDHSSNHAQTPATIFGNWSKNHMAQTPLQNRSTTSDSVRPQATPVIMSQQLSSHNVPLYGGNEGKRTRRPLAETMRSNQPSQNDKIAIPYNSVVSSSSKTRENSNRGILDMIGDKFSNKSVMQHDAKENVHPPTIEKSSINEEPPRVRASESIVKEPMEIGLKEATNENLLKVRIGNVQTYEQQPQSFRVGNSMIPANSNVPEKKNVPDRQSNVQVSIPSRIRRPHQGQTITVKGKEYLILGQLGEGMSGQVLRVQDLETLNLRAIKVVDLSRMDKDCAQGCLQEISMLHKLQAPCIVTMFDHEIKYPMVHVILEMGDTDFKSLLNSMSEKKRLPLTMILYYWTEMLTAVKHIHDNGVIHSDLKPANFLLVRGRLKLIDFGIASSMNADMTSVVKNNPIGTINYISPEALMDIGGNGGDSPNRNVNKYKITFKSDVWSLGCILYSLVYGYTPFHNIRTQWGKVNAITNPNPKISFALPTGNDLEPMPPVLIDVMRKCLQHDSKARPTVTQLLQIPYIPVKQISPTPVPDIPSNILMKIKYSLTDTEWRQFTEIMEARRGQ